MGNEPPAAPLAQLQYQSDFTLRSANVVRLVGKWCVVIGAFGVVRLGFVLASLYKHGAASLAPRSLNELAGLFIQMLNSIVSILLILCATSVLLGQTRRARWFWVLLLVMLAMRFSMEAGWLVSFWETRPTAGGMVSVVLFNVPYALLPYAILLSMARLPGVRDAIGGAR